MKPTYTPAGAAYLGKRRLRRHARVPHLWAMGVGAVISGDFFGWNFGLASGGFGGRAPSATGGSTWTGTCSTCRS